MERKKAIIIVELVDESATERNKDIARELFEWFNDDVNTMPWVKQVKNVSVRE